jgi:hypothetical protein
MLHQADSLSEPLLKLSKLILLNCVHDTWISWQRVSELLLRTVSLQHCSCNLIVPVHAQHLVNNLWFLQNEKYELYLQIQDHCFWCGSWPFEACLRYPWLFVPSAEEFWRPALANRQLSQESSWPQVSVFYKSYLLSLFGMVAGYLLQFVVLILLCCSGYRMSMAALILWKSEPIKLN